MPSRIFPFVNGHYYHIYNRGVEKKLIFNIKWDYTRFIKTMRYYQLEGPKQKLSRFLISKLVTPNPNKKIIEIVSYCLMPNHFHFLIKQLKDGGVTEFTSKLSNSYTKYFNIKHDRIGPLFQGEFKAVLVESDEQLIHLSRYIHLNPIASFIAKDLDLYPWSSYHEYLQLLGNKICNTETILGLFKSKSDYQRFILDQVDYAQKLELIKHDLIEEI